MIKPKLPLFKSNYPIFAAWDYIFTVVDVQGDQVTYQTYAVRPQPSPTYTVKVDPLVPEGSYLMLLEPKGRECRQRLERRGQAEACFLIV